MVGLFIFSCKYRMFGIQWWLKILSEITQTSHDLGQVIKLTPTSSTHLRRKRVRLQIPQRSATVQRKEKKETEN